MNKFFILSLLIIVFFISFIFLSDCSTVLAESSSISTGVDYLWSMDFTDGGLDQLDDYYESAYCSLPISGTVSICEYSNNSLIEGSTIDFDELYVRTDNPGFALRFCYEDDRLLVITSDGTGDVLYTNNANNDIINSSSVLLVNFDDFYNGYNGDTDLAQFVEYLLEIYLSPYTPSPDPPTVIYNPDLTNFYASFDVMQLASPNSNNYIDSTVTPYMVFIYKNASVHPDYGNTTISLDYTINYRIIGQEAASTTVYSLVFQGNDTNNDNILDTYYSIFSLDNFFVSAIGNELFMRVYIPSYSSSYSDIPLFSSYTLNAYNGFTNLSNIRSYGHNRGYNIGYSNGYQAGIDANVSLKELVVTVLDFPFKILFGTYNSHSHTYVNGLFTLNIFGLDVRAFVLSVVSACVIIAILRFIL